MDGATSETAKSLAGRLAGSAAALLAAHGSDFIDQEFAQTGNAGSSASSSSAPPAGVGIGLSNINASSINEDDELRLLNFPAKREDLSTAIPLTVIFALLLVTGCIGNMCTAIVIARPKNKYMHTATNYYLFSLAMSDFLFLILGLPQELYTIWQRYPYAFGESFCIIRGYLSEASTYASILTISAFTVERYVAICHPLWAHTMSQLPRAITSIVIIWLLAALCAIPPAAELGIVMQRGPMTNRILEQSAQCATKRTIYENMFAVSAIVFFIVPMIIVTVLYILIAIELRRSSKMNSAISARLPGLRACRSSSAGSQQGCIVRHGSAHAGCCAHTGGPIGAGSCGPERLATGGCCPSPSPSTLGRPAAAAQQHQALLAKIASRRPSSAIGNEHYAGEQAVARRLCRCLTAGQAAGKAPVDLALRMLPSQLPARPQHGTCEANGASHEGDATRATTMRGQLHSPLSYHESLLERRDARATWKAGAQNELCTKRHLEHAARQQSAAAEAGRQEEASRQDHYHHHHHNHHHQHQHQHQHHQHYQPHFLAHSQAYRKPAAASSKKSVIRMLVAVVVSFFICWLPFHAQRLLASYLVKDENQNQLLLDVYLKLTYISGIMYYLSSTINPLLYQLMSAKFRLAFKETFKCSLFECALLKGRAGGCSPSNSLKQQHNAEPSAACTDRFYARSSGKSATTATLRQAEFADSFCPEKAPDSECLFCRRDSANSASKGPMLLARLAASARSMRQRLWSKQASEPCCASPAYNEISPLERADAACCRLGQADGQTLKTQAPKVSCNCASSPLLDHSPETGRHLGTQAMFKFIARKAHCKAPERSMNPLERLIKSAKPEMSSAHLMSDATVMIDPKSESPSSSEQQPRCDDGASKGSKIDKKNSLGESTTTNSALEEYSTSCTTANSHLNAPELMICAEPLKRSLDEVRSYTDLIIQDDPETVVESKAGPIV